MSKNVTVLHRRISFGWWETMCKPIGIVVARTESRSKVNIFGRICFVYTKFLHRFPMTTCCSTIDMRNSLLNPDWNRKILLLLLTADLNCSHLEQRRYNWPTLTINNEHNVIRSKIPTEYVTTNPTKQIESALSIKFMRIDARNKLSNFEANLLWKPKYF